MAPHRKTEVLLPEKAKSTDWSRPIFPLRWELKLEGDIAGTQFLDLGAKKEVCFESGVEDESNHVEGDIAGIQFLDLGAKKKCVLSLEQKMRATT